MSKATKLMDSVINLIDANAQQKKDFNNRMVAKANYDALYFNIVAGLIDLYDDIQERKNCFDFYNTAVITANYRYEKNTMAFVVPYIAGLSKSQRMEIEEIIKNGMRIIIARVLPQYSRIDVFEHKIMKLSRREYGFDLIKLK